MPSNPMSEVIQYLRGTLLLPEGTELTDGQLLDCFVRSREPAALEALVRRHGPMVWGVCHRVLGNHHDTEDAFQAAFLVLVRRAASISPRAKVGCWLYGVAHQTALKARATRAKQRQRERSMTPLLEPAAPENSHQSDLNKLLDQELSRLPKKYRTVLVLCALEDRSVRETARQLDLPQGTVASRLARGKTLLAKRLARHGLAVTGATLLQQTVLTAVPATVMTATIKAVTSIASGQAAFGVISARVAALAEGVRKALLLSKLKTATAVLLVVAVLGAGASRLIHHTQAADRTEAAKKETRKSSGVVVLQGGSEFENPEMEKLQGAWQTESLIGPQGAVARDRLEDQLLVIEGQKFTRKEKGKTITEGRLAIDTTGKQKVLVMLATDRKAGVVWALYKLDGDKLTVCYELLGKGRPDQFKASATQSVATYKRKKEQGARPGRGGETRNPRPSASAAVPKEVSGKWLTPIQFPAAAEAKVAEAALALLASCHYSHVPTEGPMPDWDDLRLDALNRWCHLYIHLAKPQTITTATDEKVTVSEMLLILGSPKGGLYVRSGDKAKRFSKYEFDAGVRLQEMMKQAEPRKK